MELKDKHPSQGSLATWWEGLNIVQTPMMGTWESLLAITEKDDL